MIKKLGRFFDAKRNSHICIARVSDLLSAGVDKGYIANEFVRINSDVWKGITQDQYLWTNEIMEAQFKICPELLYCAFENGKMIATLSYIHTTTDHLNKRKSWMEKTGNGFLHTHDPHGDVAFGVDLSVSRCASKKVSSKILMSAIFIGLVGAGLRSAYLGARIPSYHKNSHLDVFEYVHKKRKNGKPIDPEIYFYLKNGFAIAEIIPEYMDDPESLNYGVLIEWKNPLHGITKKFPFLRPLIKRVCEKIFLSFPELKY